MYATDVVRVLIMVGDFADLSDPAITEVVYQAVVKHLRDPRESWECIVDNPILANWRLRPHHDQVGRVRLGCYRHTTTMGNVERERVVNEALNQLAPYRP